MRVRVEFEVEIEDGHTDEDIEEWLRFETGDNGELRESNPVSHKYFDLEPVFGTFSWNRIS